MAGFFYTLVDHAIGSFEVHDFLHDYGIIEPIEDKITELELKINTISTALTLRASSEDFHGFINRASELSSNPRIGRRYSELHWSDPLTEPEHEQQQELMTLRALIRDIETYGLWCAAANEMPELKSLSKARARIESYKAEIAVLVEQIEGWLSTAYPSGFEDVAPEFFALSDPFQAPAPFQAPDPSQATVSFQPSDPFQPSLAGVEPDDDRDPLDGEDVERMSIESCSLAAAELTSYVDIALRPAFSKAGKRTLDELSDQHWRLANELHANFWSEYDAHFAS